MKLHKEGKTFVVTTGIIFALFASIACGLNYTYLWTLAGVFFIIFIFMLRFFRSPNRPLKPVAGAVLSPCDGKIVIIQEVEETEYFKDRRLQVSVFMSVNNVHINWIPLSGKITYFRHHQGQYLVAWHPKSSEKNERTTFVINNGKTEILFRQIAGYVARRIVTYVKEGDTVEQNRQLGFIKFGSRMDLFLPLNAEICVKEGDTVRGTNTVIAKLEPNNSDKT
ncbi:MAG: phosphatidylserine decarboxylase family protein [Prevotellaceae bacterium]|jgi:phosphatidylserine decarboxylase|nr:phosphatidylserine decarboxylase family protein [Prevotellaceae bacterium]